MDEQEDMNIAKCGFCNLVIKVNTQDFVDIRTKGAKWGRKKWTAQEILHVITDTAGACEKKEGPDKKHVLIWEKEYLDGNIGQSSNIINTENRLKNNIKDRQDTHDLIIELNKKLDDAKQKIENLTGSIENDEKELVISKDILRQRTGGENTDIWVK